MSTYRDKGHMKTTPKEKMIINQWKRSLTFFQLDKLEMDQSLQCMKCMKDAVDAKKYDYPL